MPICRASPGSLPDIGHARAMESRLRIHQVRLADYPRWAEPMREEIRDNAMKVAAEAGVQIEFIRRLKAFRKEDRVKRVLEERGDAPGHGTSFRRWRAERRSATGGIRSPASLRGSNAPPTMPRSSSFTAT
ncbi:MAG: hypothetical protein F4213_10845 [Boseongicola sp. SB0677_bin_26]|nr:hypothetical protein [Boseongicola sp. SB0665_bin_10]MYG26504.1 hypothetical protein [Boseongicola sp. SB0677_bin_26]